MYNNKKLILFFGIFFMAIANSMYAKEDIIKTNNLPKKLIGVYKGTLTNLGIKTMVDHNATCTIKKVKANSYNLNFSNGVKSITNVKFNQDDDTFTASTIYGGKKIGISIDLDGDIAIGSVSSLNTIAFTGELLRSESYGSTNNTVIRNGNQTIDTNTNSTTVIRNGNQSIHTNTKGTSIKNGNQRINTKNNGNVTIRTGNTDIGTSRERRGNRGNAFYECNSDEAANLPEEVMGIYEGKLKAPGVNTNRGICKIVKTGCKIYRLDFSNNIPSIHGVQFGQMDRFKDFTSVIVEGEYSSDIEVDMRFDDLEIKKGMFNITFNGDKQ